MVRTRVRTRVPWYHWYVQYSSTMVHVYVHHTIFWYGMATHITLSLKRTYTRTYHGTYQWYVRTIVVQHYLKNDLKYKHSGATGTLPVVGVVSIEDITVYHS